MNGSNHAHDHTLLCDRTGAPIQVCLICEQFFILSCYGLDLLHYSNPEETLLGDDEI